MVCASGCDTRAPFPIEYDAYWRIQFESNLCQEHSRHIQMHDAYYAIQPTPTTFLLPPNSAKTEMNGNENKW